jgi:hypothetical protein
MACEDAGYESDIDDSTTPPPPLPQLSPPPSALAPTLNPAPPPPPPKPCQSQESSTGKEARPRHQTIVGLLTINQEGKPDASETEARDRWGQGSRDLVATKRLRDAEEPYGSGVRNGFNPYWDGKFVYFVPYSFGKTHC